MRLDDSRVLVGIMLAIIISSTTLSVLVENQNDEKFSNPIPDEQNLHLTSQKSNATLTLTDIDSPNVIDIFVDNYNSCFLNSDYEFYCWGEGTISTWWNQGSDTHFPVLINFGAIMWLNIVLGLHMLVQYLVLEVYSVGVMLITEDLAMVCYW